MMSQLLFFFFTVHLKRIGASEVGACDALAPKVNVVVPFVIHSMWPPVAFLKLNTNLVNGVNKKPFACVFPHSHFKDLDKQFKDFDLWQTV